MNNSRSCVRSGISFILFAAFAVLTFIGAPTAAQAGPVVLVPAYFYPGGGGPGGVGDGWAAMTTAAGENPITAIFNPNSGPLPGPADPNYVNAISNLEAAGGQVVAYVPTGYGSTPVATVEANIQTYITQYGSLIKGFFLDELNITPSTLSNYQSIESYIKGLSASYSVFGNTGIPFLNGVSPQELLSTADHLVIFEGPNTAPAPGAAGFDAYPYGLNWFQSYPSDRFANIVFDVPADVGHPDHSAAMVADLQKAVQLNAGYVYFTDQSGGNPYSHLPSYWDQEVAAIRALPEPGAFTILASAAVVSMVLVARRRAGRKA